MAPWALPLLSTLAAFNSLLAVGLLGVYLKFSFLGRHWFAVARFLGKDDPAELSLLDGLGFFHNDIVLNLLVIPLAGTVLLRLVFRRKAGIAAFILSVLLTLFYFAELRAQAEVGQYISRDVLRDLVGWTLANPGSGSDYVTTASLIKLAVLFAVLVCIAAIAVVGEVAERQGRTQAVKRYRQILLIPATAILGTAVALTPLSRMGRLHDSLLNESSVGRAASALLVNSGNAGAFHNLSLDEALASSRRLTGTQPFEPHHSFVGRERDSDVIIFMMETGPVRALDLSKDAGSLPGASVLYKRALIAEQHYTTHPYSSDAMYSILSGLYPHGRRQVLRGATATMLNGLMSARREEAPVRRVYVPSVYYIELDERMHGIFGAETFHAVDKMSDDPVRPLAERRAVRLIADLERSGSRFEKAIRERLVQRLRADFQTLEHVKADITEAVRAGRRYCVLYFPQIGHAPWAGLRPNRTVLERGRALMMLQDTWLKEIVETIRKLGRLEHTVIALTADHGIRTRAEDPALAVGQISDYTFQVPLLVYAPQTLTHTVRVTSPTSHIDFAPTLLALLGDTDAAARMQGIPIWQRKATDRIYLLGSAYGGADGFVQDGTYYMRQSMSGAVYRSRDFAFGEEDQARPGDPVIPFVNDALEQLQILQHAIVGRVLTTR